MVFQLTKRLYPTSLRLIKSYKRFHSSLSLESATDSQSSYEKSASSSKEMEIIGLLKSLTPPNEKVPVSSLQFNGPLFYYQLIPFYSNGTLSKSHKRRDTLNRLVPQMTKGHLRTEDSPFYEDYFTTMLYTIQDKYMRYFQPPLWLGIVEYYCCYGNFSRANKVMNRLLQHTKVEVTADFYNPFLVQSNETCIEKLQRMKKKRVTPNTNTWYQVFKLMNSHQSKHKLIDLMDERGIEHEPRSEVFKFLEKKKSYENKDVQMIESAKEVNKVVKEYLEKDEPLEAWNSFEKKYFLIDRPYLNEKTVEMFIDYFAEKSQLHNSIAVANSFKARYNLPAKEMLSYRYVTRNMTKIQYFDRWSCLLRGFLRNIPKSLILKDSRVKELNEYAIRNGIQPVSLDNRSGKRKSGDGNYFSTVFCNLVWRDFKMKPNIRQNDKRFQAVAYTFFKATSKNEKQEQPDKELSQTEVAGETVAHEILLPENKMVST